MTLLLILLMSAAAAPDKFSFVEANLKQGRFIRALGILRPLYDKSPDDPDLQLLLGYALAGRMRCSEALPLILPHASAPRFSAPVAGLVSSCYEQQGDLSEAIYWMEQAVDLAQDPVGFEARLALLYFKTGEEDRAAALLETLDPENAYTLQTRLTVDLSLGDMEAVDDTLSRMMTPFTLGQPYPYRFYSRGLVALALGDLREAEEMLSRSAERLTSHLPSRGLWAEVIRREGYPEDALEILRDVGEYTPEEAVRSALDPFLARALIDQGDLPGARALTAAALRRDPFSPDPIASAWYLARAEGDRAAMARWEARYAPVQPSPWSGLAQLLPPEKPQR